MTPTPILEPPIVDGFTHSTSTLLLPTTYRSLVMAQMETLRRSSNYQFKIYSAPDSQNQAIPAYSQNEYLIKMRPGTLIWGMWISDPGGKASLANLFTLVTDLGTGTALISDYELSALMSAALTPPTKRNFGRYPCLLSEPRIVSGEGQVIIETYNSSANPITCQLVLFCAEPVPLPDPCADSSLPCETE